MADPFPFLPRLDSPRIYDASLGETMEDISGRYYEEQFTPSGNLLLDQTVNDSPFSPAATKPTDGVPSNLDPSARSRWADSPESSSSSDASNQQKRKYSNESSTNDDTSLADTPMANGILIGADPVPSTVMNQEESNEFMESMLNFDGADSSPVSNLETTVGIDESQTKGINMPVRAVPALEAASSFTSKSSGSTGSPEAPVTMMFDLDRRNRRGQPSQTRNIMLQQPETTCAPSNLVLPGADVGPFQVANDFPWSGFGVPPFEPPSSYPPLGTTMPYASPVTSGSPRLTISNFGPKTRVETQHILKYTLDPLPPGITKLHLQRYSISKPKMMAKPAPARSPDTLELFATVVCSSAMQNEEKYRRAFARARKPLGEQVEHCPSSNKETVGLDKKDADNTDEDDEDRPLNGGPVLICKGCVEREVRRVERRKTIIPDEQLEWEELGGQRTIVFNRNEMQEWTSPSEFAPKSNPRKEKFPHMRHYDIEPNFSARAMQVDIPTRISCYCRHHSETVGFRILVTIRDHQDKVVAQAMSNSIMITDDHKTNSALPGPQDTNMVPLGHAPGIPPAHFPIGPPNYHPNNPLSRNKTSFSTTALDQFASPHHYGAPGQMRTQPMPQDFSMMNSTAFPPRNLSRPGSPTLPTSQQSKRRKASGSTRIRSELAMTKMSNSSTPSPSSAFPNAGYPTGPYPRQAGFGNFSPNNVDPSGYSYPPHPFQHPTTNPPTPMRSGFSPEVMSGQRSQSMENLTHNGISASSSAMSSRRPSPRMSNGIPPPNHQEGFNGFPYVNGPAQPAGMPQHAQMLQSQLSSIATTPTRAPEPIIQKLIPAEGPMGGGTEVSCMGTGFYRGLEVMFGDALATKTTFWGADVILCQAPPAKQPGPVVVTFKHQYDAKVELPPDQQRSFTYFNNDQAEMMKMLLTMWAGRNSNSNPNGLPSTDSTKDEAMNMFVQQMAGSGTFAPPNQGSEHGNEYERRMPTHNASKTQAETEAFIVQCLEQMDLDETPGQANLNLQGPCGQTMLHLTASLGYYRVAANLLTRGAHPDIGDKNGMSPLHMAALHGHIRIVKKLRAAGSDPCLRSLNGFTPADMTSNLDVQDAVNALDQRSRSRSAAATPVTGTSRATSVHSQASSGFDYDSSRLSHAVARSGEFERYTKYSITSAQLRNRSRRNSFGSEDHRSSDVTRTGLKHNASQLETQSALTAWRDQLSMQIQHFQETVHRALPPLPNLPNYQYYPVVRRISSLVPQRNTPLLPNSEIQDGEKEGQYGWLELVLGPREPPPPYVDQPEPKPHEQSHEEKSPLFEQSQSDNNIVHDAKAPLMRAAIDSFADQKCEAMYDQAESSSEMETINIGSKGLTQQEQARVRSAYAKKVKKLRKDRNFLFIWLPLFILFLMVALKDGASHVAYITLTYSDPSSVYPAIAESLRSRLPLRNLNWNSTSRPFRSIPSLHVELVRDATSTRPLKEVEGDWAIKSDEAKEEDARQGRRHQIPGLRQSPYLKIYFLRCDDVETYRATSRKDVRDWINGHTPESQKSSSVGKKDNHDAFEWLIVQVIDKGLDRSSTPEASNDNKKDGASKRFSTLSRMSSRTSSSTNVIEKVRSDFNGTSKNAVDRVVQITLEGDKLGFDDLVVKMKALILASFDLRVAQYEDDIREKEMQRTLPGWNFNTFFVLKEGLARGFEAVGLLEDALSGYHELSTGLNAIVEDQNGEDEAKQAAAPFNKYTEELREAYSKAIDIGKESSDAQSEDVSDLGSSILDTSRKDFRNLILANNISIFDFQCYVFARESALLLRLANAGNASSKIINGHRRSDSVARAGLAKPNNEEPENLLVLAEICQLASEFIALGAGRMRKDIETSIEQLDSDPAEDDADAFTSTQSDVIDNLIQSWTNSVCESVLEATSSLTLSTQLRPLLGHLLPHKKLDTDTPQSISVVSRRHERLPDRTSSLTGASKPKTPVQESFSSISTSDGLRLLPPGTTHPGAQELAAQRGSLHVLSRRALSTTASRVKGWQGGLAVATSRVTELELQDVDLDNPPDQDDYPKGRNHAHEPTTKGIRNETLTLALNSEYEFYKAFEQLTATALAHFVVASRTNAAEGMTADLAVVRFHLKDYKSAVSYFDQLASFYGKGDWITLEFAMLDMHAQCLKELGRTESFIQVTLKAMALQKEGLDLSSHTYSSLSEIITDSSSLLQPLTVPLDDHFHDVKVNPYLLHYPNHDGFQMILCLRSLLPESFQADTVRIKLISAEKERSGEHWLSIESPQQVQKGQCKFQVGTKEMHPGWYRLAGVNIHAKNIVFVDDRSAKANVSLFSAGRDSGSLVKADAKGERLLIWARSQHFNVQAGPSDSIDLRRPKSIKVEVFSGWNQIRSGLLSIKAASAGLRLDTAEAKSQSNPGDNKSSSASISTKKYQPGIVDFGSLSPSRVLTIQIPYSLENDQNEIAVKIQAGYKTDLGEFVYASDFKINVNLPVSVNVQDIFKQDALFSKFTIGTATSIPLRLHSCCIEGNSNYEALSPTSLNGPIDVFARQPYSFISKIKHKQTSNSQNSHLSKTFQRLLHLQIEYQCLEEDIYAVLESSLSTALEASSLQDFMRPLKGILRLGVRSRHTAHEFETICLLGETLKGHFDNYDWRALLPGFSIKDRQVLEGALRAWHEDTRLITLSSGSPLRSQRQYLTVPFDLPSINWIHTAQFRWGGRSSISDVAVDQPLPVQLVLSHSRRWDAGSGPESKAETKDFIYEVHSSPDTWLIGGQRRAKFSANDGGTQSFELLLVPQTAGRLLYPSVEITPTSTASRNQDDNGEESSVSSETDFLSQGETVLVVPNLASTTVSLDPGNGAWLVESRSREL